MTRRELGALGSVIEWAVSPRPPLPALAETDAVAALARTFARGSRLERLALRGLLAALATLPRHRRVRCLSHLQRGPAAPLGDALATLAQLSYYGDLGVMRELGYDPDRVRARGAAVRAAEGRG